LCEDPRYFPVTCNPTRGVPLSNIGVSLYIGVPRRITYPYFAPGRQSCRCLPRACSGRRAAICSGGLAWEAGEKGELARTHNLFV